MAQRKRAAPAAGSEASCAFSAALDKLEQGEAIGSAAQFSSQLLEKAKNEPWHNALASLAYRQRDETTATLPSAQLPPLP